MSKFQRRLPIGAEVQPTGGVHFRVWAPRRKGLELVLEEGSSSDTSERPKPRLMEREPSGHWSLFASDARAESRYRFRIDGNAALFPDPASRFQPEGVHGPSEVVDPGTYSWRQTDWPGVTLAGQVIYELHVGTFTREGTLSAAARELPELARLGVTLIEVMPLNEFPGRFGWGYDGVDLFAPTRLYGRPDDLRRFVDDAHAAGLGVILDVVYNHFGPSGNYVRSFAEDIMHRERANEWGESLNFDGENSDGVREFFVSNAGYWIDEFHFDGLRLDATQAIHDNTTPHVLAEISRRVRTAAGGRGTLIFAENERQDAIQARPCEAGGHGLDGVWNDDFHHSAVVALTGHNDYYYGDYRGRPQELISAIKWGFLFQGQRCKVQQSRRGTPAFDIPAPQFVTFLENHDQVANSARGLRLHQQTSPAKFRAMTALWLLAPGTPMFFQGQEYGATTPFLYFADHEPELAQLVRKGRFDFLKNFRNVATAEMAQALADPESEATFERCKLDFSERVTNQEAMALHRDLLKLRREDAVFRAQRGDRLQCAILADEAFVLRYFGDDGDDRLVAVNLGCDEHFDPAPEPLLAPPLGRDWRKIWSSEAPEYGGSGTPQLESEENWRFPGRTTVVMAAVAPEATQAQPGGSIRGSLANEDRRDPAG
jgi:maltooligosyltrehalose trehalohydrolase